VVKSSWRVSLSNLLDNLVLDISASNPHCFMLREVLPQATPPMGLAALGDDNLRACQFSSGLSTHVDCDTKCNWAVRF